ncbi:MAG TPA: hypothetical protein VFH06_04650 [Candidatus Saccharimonadales bacterium]|nr:hypothetical protein [Candidatus Saccharimonadales bacterium]
MREVLVDVDDPVEGLYHFFLMGLMWLREAKPDVLARRGSSVFSSLARATPVFKSARTLVLQSWDLMERVCEHSVVHNDEEHLGTRELRKLIAQSEKHNVVLVVPAAESLGPDKLFGPGGYSHAITDAGIEHAMSVAGRYSAIITIDTFLQGWAKHKHQMASFNAKTGSASSTQGPGEGVTEGSVGNKYIPPAPYGEADFDF